MLEIIKVVTVLAMAVPFIYMLVNVAFEIVRTTSEMLSRNVKPVYIRIRRHPQK